MIIESKEEAERMIKFTEMIMRTNFKYLGMLENPE